MGKTIALKLSEKEEQIVTQLNKQGITNSVLLRTALRQYFENINNSSTQKDQMKTTVIGDKNTNIEFSGSMNGLRQEIQELWKQMEKKHKQVDNNIMTLQRQMFLLSIDNRVSKQITDTTKFDIVCDIHNEVDEFLKKQSKQINL